MGSVLQTVPASNGEPSQTAVPREPEIPAWTSNGGSYKQESFPVPENTESVLCYNGELYYLTLEIGAERVFFGISHDGAALYTAEENSSINMVCASEEGVWFLEAAWSIDARYSYTLKLISRDGELLRSFTPDGDAVDARGIMYAGEKLYLAFGDYVEVYSIDGEKLSEIALPVVDCSFISNGYGAFIACYTENGIEVISAEDGEPVFTLPDLSARLHPGADGYNFLLSDSTGLYGVSSGGAERKTLIVWADCGISFSGLRRVFTLDGGRFLCVDELGMTLLTGIPPEDMVIKKPLTLATVASSRQTAIAHYASGFNLSNNLYSVVIKDYSELGGGAVGLTPI